MSFFAWLFRRKPQAPAPLPWLPDTPPESWTLGDYWVDWHDIGLPYASRDGDGAIMQHSSPPFPNALGFFVCYGDSAHYDETAGDGCNYTASSPVPMEFETDDNGYMVRVYPDWMREVDND